MKVSYWNSGVIAWLAVQQTIISAAPNARVLNVDGAAAGGKLRDGNRIGWKHATILGAGEKRTRALQEDNHDGPALQTSLYYSTRQHVRHMSDRDLATQQPESRELLHGPPHHLTKQDRDLSTQQPESRELLHGPPHHHFKRKGRDLSTQQPESRELLNGPPHHHRTDNRDLSTQQPISREPLKGPPHQNGRQVHERFTPQPESRDLVDSPPQNLRGQKQTKHTEFGRLSQTSTDGGLHPQKSIWSSSHTYRSLSADEPQEEWSKKSVEEMSPLGICYDPSHAAGYPLNNGDPSHVAEILDRDFAQLSTRFSVVRTYSAQYYGKDVASVAKKYNMELFIGLHDYENEELNESERKRAVTSAVENPDTVKAIIVGNEDLFITGGKKSVEAIISLVERVKKDLAEAGISHVLVGTAQQSGAFLNEQFHEELVRLVEACDVVGLNIYPFFSNGYNHDNPSDLLDKQWNQVLECLPSSASKFVITETGFPSSGSPPEWLPANVPSPAEQKSYFEAVETSSPNKSTTKTLVFWFMAYDRRGDDPLVSHHDYERYFGLYTAEGEEKGVF
uniref:glucan endo-1,3-beta-D-glucosidase n=1 Tax=Albugo laibachii Nc14 TaxID=890382 RepID=F0W7I2_9STRA|nr:conserved hypothetical protein [Albugo laibachii Nc14]|eukprot:CCA17083.1 conserved hypothetical protein [Albugo laibachii Nc14]